LKGATMKKKEQIIRYPSHEKWAASRYKVFEEKIEALKDHPKYPWLRKYADDAKIANEGGGYYMIKAEDFIERIENADVSYIRDWLDGKNQLEWSGIQKEEAL